MLGEKSIFVYSRYVHTLIPTDVLVCAVASRYRQSDALFKSLLAEAHREGLSGEFSSFDYLNSLHRL